MGLMSGSGVNRSAASLNQFLGRLILFALACLVCAALIVLIMLLFGGFIKVVIVGAQFVGWVYGF